MPFHHLHQWVLFSSGVVTISLIFLESLANRAIVVVACFLTPLMSLPKPLAGYAIVDAFDDILAALFVASISLNRRNDHTRFT